MSASSTNGEQPGHGVGTWVTLVLSVSAACAMAFGLFQALGAGDTEAYESPLMLSVARQLVRGPWELYGPFGRDNPLVLIHSPLYYHLAALLAWPIKHEGLDPISAARLAGRLLSLVGLGVTACSAYAITRLDRAPRRAGWWAVCLITSTPVVGAMPFTVRPDMLGVALQTTGVYLLLKSIGSERPKVGSLALAFAALGLAMCVKQHFVAGLLAGTSLSLWACRRGKLPVRATLVGILSAGLVLVVFYGIEESTSGGRMSQAVFVAAAAAARIHPSDWVRAGIVVSAIVLGSTSLIALLATAGLARIASSRATVCGKVAGASFALVAFAALMPFVQTLHPTATGGILSAAAVYLCLLVVIPACVLLERRLRFSRGVDFELCLFLAVETGIVLFLCRASTGAWINYGIQGVVFVAILTGRSSARVLESAQSRAMGISMVLVSASVLGVVLKDSYLTYQRARVDRLAVLRLLEEIESPRSQVYFVARPGLNRLYGQTDLVHDDWLYPVFESVRLAEPRSSWLESALGRGSVRVVVNMSDDSRIDGLDKPLPDLGYVRRFQVGSYYVWERVVAWRGR
jgi:hypothetical protein